MISWATVPFYVKEIGVNCDTYIIKQSLFEYLSFLILCLLNLRFWHVELTTALCSLMGWHSVWCQGFQSQH